MAAIRGAERERLLREGKLVVIPLGQVGPGPRVEADAAVAAVAPGRFVDRSRAPRWRRRSCDR